MLTHGLIVTLGCLQSITPADTAEIVWDIAISNDEKMLATVGRNHYVRVWDLEKGEMKTTLKSNYLTDLFTSVVFSPDSKRIVVGNITPDGGSSPVWEISSGKIKLELSIKQTKSNYFSPRVVNYDSKGKFIVGYCDDYILDALIAWNATDGKIEYIIQNFIRDEKGIVSFIPIPNTSAFLLAFPSLLTIWDAYNEFGYWAPSSFLDDSVRFIKFADDTKSFAFTYSNEDSSVFEVNAFTVDKSLMSNKISSFTFNENYRTLEWDSKRKKVYFGCLNGRIAVYDSLTGKTLKTWIGHEGRHIRTLKLIKNGKILMSGAGGYHALKGGSICFWDTEYGKLLLTLQVFITDNDKGSYEWIAFTPEGFYNGSKSIEKIVKWEPSDIKPKKDATQIKKVLSNK